MHFVRPPPYHKSVRKRIQQVLGKWNPHVLTQEEIDDIRNDCEQRRVAIADMESKVDQVAPERKVEYQQNLWLTRLDHDILYFRIFRVNDLPNEILSNIIRYIIWSAPEPPMGILWRLQLTWVCRHWRNAAIGDPTLWNAIWFRDHPPFERSLTFVQRSRNSAMDIRINDTNGRRFTFEEVNTLLERLTPHLPNIRMLIVLFQTWDCILSFLSWLDKVGSTTDLILERLEIHRTGSAYQWPSRSWQPPNHTVTLYPLFGGKHIPTLNYITLNALHVDWMKTSFENLTTLDIRRIPLELCPKLDRFREMLASCPKLDKLSLDGAGPRDQPDLYRDKEPVLLNSLRTLVIANFTADFIYSIITHIAAPHVRDLTIMNFTSADYSPFYSHITNKFRQVRLLTLYTLQCKPDGINTFLECLKSFPHLTYLRLAGVGPDVLGLFLYEAETLEPHPDLGDPLANKIFGMRPENPDLHTSATTSTSTSSEAASEATSTSSSKATSTSYIPSIFTGPINIPSTDTETPKTSQSAPSRQPRLISPCMNVIEVQRVQVPLFTHWVEARKKIGVPVARVYMPPDMYKDLRIYSVVERCEAAIGDIQVMTLGAKTPEEDALLTAP